MSVTVWGDAGGPRQIAEERRRWGAIELHTGAHSYDSLSLELPDDGVIVDLDHDGEAVGSLVHAELGADDRLRCVAVVDGRLERAFEECEVFFSPKMAMYGKGIDESDTYIAREAELLGLSLTLATKRIGAWPLRHRSGDLRSEGDRRSWPVSWRSDPLLARAVEGMTGIPLTELRHRSASRIVDLHPNEDEFPWHGLKPGDRVPADLMRSTLPNGLRIGAPGKILRVS
jgi:hypothetical protein